MPLVEPPIACKTVMALWNEASVRIVVRDKGVFVFSEMEMAAATAFLPVSSATRSRVLETAGAVLLNTFSDCSHRHHGLEQPPRDDAPRVP